MMNDGDYLKTSTGSFRLRADGLALMMKGAAYAAIFCLVFLIGAAVLVGVSKLLPDASKEGYDPTPNSFLLDGTAKTVRVI